MANEECFLLISLKQNELSWFINGTLKRHRMVEERRGEIKDAFAAWLEDEEKEKAV